MASKSDDSREVSPKIKGKIQVELQELRSDVRRAPEVVEIDIEMTPSHKMPKSLRAAPTTW